MHLRSLIWFSRKRKKHVTYNIIDLKTHFLLQLQLQITFLQMKILANKFLFANLSATHSSVLVDIKGVSLIDVHNLRKNLLKFLLLM